MVECNIQYSFLEGFQFQQVQLMAGVHAEKPAHNPRFNSNRYN